MQRKIQTNKNLTRQMKKTVTVRDLASKLKISRTTISLALRNHPSVAAKTKQRILAAADQMGYRRNALVNALMSQVRRGKIHFKGEILAFLTAHTTEFEWQQFHSHVEGFAGAQKKAEELGFRLDHFWVGEKGKYSSKVSKVLQARGIHGSILAPTTWGIESLDFDLPWKSHPVVVWGFSNKNKPVARVCSDHFHGMLECYQQLRKTGHQKIGFVIEQDVLERPIVQWKSSFRTSQEILGGQKIPILSLGNPYDKTAFIEWFEKYRQDAIIGYYPDRALQWLQEHGLKIPQDLSYVALDLNLSQKDTPAGIDQNHAGCGAIAVELLVGQLSRNEFGYPPVPSITMIQGQWVNKWTHQPRS